MQGNLKKLLAKIKDTDLVLDIGGGTKPLARANYVIDFKSYQERAKQGLIGDGPEKFNSESWISHDICSKQPFPFNNKQFDFVFCSHTLEDIKDPIWVCQEIMRIGKRGYIETPSRWIESKVGVGGKYKYPKKLAGFFNHLWFVEIKNDALTFTTKTPFIHIIKTFQIKNIKTPILEFYWEDNFTVKENLILSLESAVNDIYEFKLLEIKNEFQKKILTWKKKRILSLPLNLKIKYKLKNIFSFK